MEQKTLVSKEDRKRKLLLVLPLFFLPFIILLFYSLGGGRGKAGAAEKPKGLNTDLPSAQIVSKPVDKLSIYKQADDDSARKSEKPLFDPYAGAATGMLPAADDPKSLSPYDVNQAAARLTRQSGGSLEQNEARAQQKLDALQSALNRQAAIAPTPLTPDQGQASGSGQSYAGLPALHLPDRPSTDQPQDSELLLLNEMLNKALDVQHPERVKERLKTESESHPTAIFSVTNKEPEVLDEWNTVMPTKKDSGRIASIQKAVPGTGRFFELDESGDSPAQNAVKAVVHETQLLVSGATIKLRLEDETYIHGQLIPAGTFVYGTCELTGERLKVAIDKIVYGPSIYPVSLKVYDTDGLEGIRIPGSISRDAAKQGTDQALQSIQLAEMNPSLSAQAAASGVETLKNLLQRKVKLIKVTVKADHPVLLLQGNG